MSGSAVPRASPRLPLHLHRKQGLERRPAPRRPAPGGGSHPHQHQQQWLCPAHVGIESWQRRIKFLALLPLMPLCTEVTTTPAELWLSLSTSSCRGPHNHAHPSPFPPRLPPGGFWLCRPGAETCTGPRHHPRGGRRDVPWGNLSSSTRATTFSPGSGCPFQRPKRPQPILKVLGCPGACGVAAHSAQISPFRNEGGFNSVAE